MDPYRTQSRVGLRESEIDLLHRLEKRLSHVPEKYQQFIDKIFEREEACSVEFEEALFAYDLFFSHCFDPDLNYTDQGGRISEVVEDLLRRRGGFHIAGDYLSRRFTGLQPSSGGLSCELAEVGVNAKTYYMALHHGTSGDFSVESILSSIEDSEVYAKVVNIFTSRGLYDPYFDED